MLRVDEEGVPKVVQSIETMIITTCEDYYKNKGHFVNKGLDSLEFFVTYFDGSMVITQGQDLPRSTYLDTDTGYESLENHFTREYSK